MIVVAFKGSFPPTEIKGPHEISYRDLKTFQPTGGKIMEYSKKTHDILFPCVKATLQRLLTSQPTAAVLITGHSDGGAQAQLAGARLLAEEMVSKAKLHIYTFGSPRVGDVDFAYYYDRLVGNSWRVTRREDFTPLTVSKDNYPFFHHTRREIYYHYSGVMRPSSDYEICKSNGEESGCIEWQGRLSAKSSTRNSNQYFVPDLQRYMKGMVVKGLNHLLGYMNMDCRVMPIGRSID
ncbi:hypothetical protein EB796_007232 [Bugula neritina]|uniref:Fungal lipase-type domain-containing protein n=1 Tax=Bugula neritina TaxID=10212 RepID=A0A7J7KA73_BUGNE|nr:hypothetical protein EB796_007232 [Bugula neritina]